MTNQPTNRVQSWAVEAASILTRQTNIALASKLKFHTQTEATTLCPFGCGGDGEDRFIIFAEGNYFCRQCGSKGFWRSALSEDEKKQLAREKELSRQETRRRLQSCQDWKIYHTQAESHLDLWQQHGVLPSDVKRWQLGYEETFFQTPSLTIPIFFDGILCDIRHRLLSVDSGNKYRSHFKDTPPTFFNGDMVRGSQRLFLVEGEKKAIILERHGISPTISYPGINTQDSLIAFLHNHGTEGQEIIYIPDPNTIDTILQAGRELNRHHRNVSVVELFLKPDDLLLEYGVTPLRNAIGKKKRVM